MEGGHEGTHRVGTQNFKQSIRISDKSPATVDQPLVLLGRAQCQRIPNLGLELLDGRTSRRTWESQGLWDADRRRDDDQIDDGPQFR